MKIKLFRNGTGMIHGGDPKRVSCDRDGTLKIGGAELEVTSGEKAIMPYLFFGASGNYDAVFTDREGKVYVLGRVVVRSGRIAPPSPVALEIMELKCRADTAEAECECLAERVRALEGIFDTNSLNFLIK